MASHAARPGEVIGASRPRPAGAHSAPLWRRALDAVRLQAESGDSPDSLLLTYSLGGGTGSGLGSRLLELLRDEYPSMTIVAACVAPFLSGDTPLQYYNMALSLATAHECADAVVFFDNDDLGCRARLRQKWSHEAADKAAAAAHGGFQSHGPPPLPFAGERGTLNARDLNVEVARSLSAILTPTVGARYSAGFLRGVLRSWGSSGGGGGDRPSWVDVREGVPPADAPFSSPFLYEASEEGVGDGPPALPDPTLLSELVRALVVSPALKYLDVRGVDDECLSNAYDGSRGGGSGAVASDNPFQQSPWVQLADHLAEIIPRGVSSGPSAAGGRPCLDLARTSSGGGGLSQSRRSDGGGRPSSTSGSGYSLLRAHLVVRGMEADQYPELQHHQDGEATTIAGRGTSAAAATASRNAARAAAAALETIPGLPPLRSGGSSSGGSGGSRGGGSASSTSYSGRGGAPGSTTQWRDVSQRLARGTGCTPLQLSQWSSQCSPSYDSKGGGGGGPTAPVCHRRSLTLCTNSNWMVPTLSRCVERASTLLEAGAYVHWFERFGIDEEHIGVAVDSVADVVSTYSSARH